MQNNSNQKISTEKFTKFKHIIGIKNTFDGFNGEDIIKLEKLSEAQYRDLQSHISYIKRTWWFFPSYVWIFGIIISCITIIFSDNALIKIASFIFISVCIFHLSYRSGLVYGFIRGFEEGHIAGIHKAFGVSAKDASELRNLETEIKMDEFIINNRNIQSPEQHS